MIQCINLTKKFYIGEQTIVGLNHLNCVVEQGEFVAICGKSGCGKSTLLNMLGLIDTPTEGTILMDGVDLYGLNAVEKARVRNQKIGYIFQSFYLDPSYTAYANIEMPLLIPRVPKKERKEVFRMLHKAGRTIVMVTHSEDDTKYADRVIYMKDGTIL